MSEYVTDFYRHRVSDKPKSGKFDPFTTIAENMPDYEKKTICELRNRGYSITEISGEMDYATKVISIVLNQYNLK